MDLPQTPKSGAASAVPEICFRNFKSLTRGSPGTAGRLLESWIGLDYEIFESACPKSRALHRKRGMFAMSRALLIPPECYCMIGSVEERMLLLIPEFCPGGQSQRLTLDKSTLLVRNDSKKASKPIESPHLVPGPCIEQNSLFVAA